ncbi:Dabb family protein [Sulfurospirillum sp. 1307]
MVKHIVFFKLEDNSNEHKEYVKNLIMDLKDKIEVIQAYEVGINFSDEERAYDLALISDFKSKEDLQTYATHPLHVEVVNYLRSKNTVTKVVDYEY